LMQLVLHLMMTTLLLVSSTLSNLIIQIV